MQKQMISPKQAIMMIGLFTLGTTFLLAVGASAGKDIWIAYLIALAISIALMWIYGRILGHMPGKDFYGILESVLGRTLSRLILIPLAIYLFQFSSYVIRNFSHFVDTAGLPEAPTLVPYLGVGLTAVLAVYLGIEILGRWSEFFLPFVAVFAIVSMLILSKYMKVDNLLPVLEKGWAPVMKGTVSVISLPFAQTVAFLFVLPPFSDKKIPRRVFPLGLLLGAALVFITSIQDVLVLGVGLVNRLYYPTYTTLSIIRIGNFIQRLEIVAATVFTLAVFLKFAILLMALCKAIGYILGLKDHRFLAIPVLLLIINYATFSFTSDVQFQTWTINIWPYYSAIFQVLIPVVLFVLLKWLSAKRSKKKQDSPLMAGK